MSDNLEWFGGHILISESGILFTAKATNVSPRIYYEYPLDKQQLISLRDALIKHVDNIKGI